MKRLRKKLHSERGASILLAMLLLLVCMLVAASIMAAAGSNAGKYRSNRVEQQKYLTLSSAIRLVADELQEAKYTGNYRVYEWREKHVTGHDADNNEIVYYTYHFHIQQVAGDYSCGVKRSGDANPGELTALVPLAKELDAIFSKQFTGTGYTALSGGEITEPSLPATSIPHTLTITLPDGLSGYPYPGSGPAVYQVPKEVTVQVELDHTTKHIKLTAWLGDGALADAIDVMSAELVAKNAPTIDYAPAGRTAAALPSGEGAPTPTIQDESTSTMQWELHWIRKGAA